MRHIGTVITKPRWKDPGTCKDWPTGICYVTYPASYEHKCDKCGKTAEYRSIYPELRYENP